MRKERWRAMIGFPFYQVSDHGRVKSLARKVNCMWGESKRQTMECIITPGIDKFGYHQVHIQKRNFRIHRLVAIHFIKNPHNKPEVNHFDNDPGNNYYKNLKWATRLENMRHCFSQGRNPNMCRKLTEKQVIAARNRYEKGNITITNLGTKYGVTRPTMERILKRKVYKNI